MTDTAIRVPTEADRTSVRDPSPPGRLGRWPFRVSLLLTVLWVALTWTIDLPVLGYIGAAVVLVMVAELMQRRSLRGLIRHASGLDPLRRSLRGGRKVLLVIAILSLVLHTLLVEDAWADSGGVILAGLLLGAGAYLACRRIVVTLLVVTVLLGVGGFALAPRLAAAQSGDPELLGQLTDLHGFHRLSAVTVDLNAAQPVRHADIGGTANDRFEVGSMTKAMTGLVIADQIRRGELRLSDRLSAYLPVQGTALADVTLEELVTHRSGLPRDSAATLRSSLWRQPLGLRLFGSDENQLLQEARAARPAGRGTVQYSNIGAALAGQAAARAAGMSYPELMRTRLFEPLGMTDSSVQTTPIVDAGHNAAGLPVQPWPMTGYAPAGAVVSTAHDLTLLATALLNGRAPGMDALTPICSRGDGPRLQIGIFWHLNTWPDGRTVTWHDGQTGGYSSLMYLDRDHRRASILLSDVAVSGNELGNQLLIT